MLYYQNAPLLPDYVLLADMNDIASSRISQALRRLLDSERTRNIVAQVFDGLPTMQLAERYNVSVKRVPGDSWPRISFC